MVPAKVSGVEGDEESPVLEDGGKTYKSCDAVHQVI